MIAIPPFAKSLRAVAALERLKLLVHLSVMLRNVRLLAESFAAPRECAHERPLPRMSAHVVHELGGIPDELVAATFVLTLEESRLTRVALVLAELEDHELGRRGNLDHVGGDLAKVEVVARDGLHMPLVFDARELISEGDSEFFREHSSEGDVVWCIQKLIALAGHLAVEAYRLGRLYR